MVRGANSPQIGDYNRRVIIDAIRQAGVTSRVELAAASGLTGQTVSNIVGALLAEGLVVEVGREPSDGGKPRTLLQLCASSAYAVGVQIDPKETTVVLVDLLGHVVDRSHTAMDPRARELTVINRTATRVTRMFERHPEVDGKVVGIGLAAPGPLNAKTGQVLSPPNFPSWGQADLCDPLEKRLGLPVLLENDATASAAAQLWARTAVPGDFVFVYVGYGVGAGLCLGGEIYRGTSGNAGEIGHIAYDRNGPQCRCGRRGCVELYCTSEHLVSEVLQVPREKSRLGLSGTPASRDTDHEKILVAAASGDAVARAVVGESAAALAEAIVSLVNIVDVGTVVLGGSGVRHVFEIYREVILDRLRAGAMAAANHEFEVLPAVSGQDAGSIGAATLMLGARFAPWGGVTASSGQGD